MRVVVTPVTAFQQNSSLLVCEATRRAALIDPGGDVDRILEAVAAEGASVEKILLTHGHADHCGGTAELVKRLGVPVEGPHPDDLFLIEALPTQGRRFGLAPMESFVPDRWLADGDTVGFGEVTLDVRHCPGHTPGHVIFHSAADRLAFVGDVLFRGSIGRTDFPRGDHATLVASIRNRLWPLGDDVRFVPGHGPMSTFGAERRGNPFVADGV